MTIKLILPFLIASISYCTQVNCQQMMTNIKSQVNMESTYNNTIESLFSLSEMPKIRADIEIIEDRMVEVNANLKMTIAKLLVIVNIKDIVGEKFITSKNFVFTGSGKSEADALKNAFTKIKIGGNNIRSFLEQTNNAADKPSCEQAEKKINQYINEGNTKFALHLANQVSFYCPQYGQIYDNTFDKIQLLNCDKYILNSKSYAANKEFDKAIREILMVDPASKCYAKAKSQLDAISKDFDIQSDKLYTVYKEIGEDKLRHKDFILTLLLQNKH